MRTLKRMKQAGFTMIEVLITIAILLLGLLGLAGLQMQISVAELEAFQRAQALVLVQDMVDRMAANKAELRANPGSYVASDIGASGVADDCTGYSAGYKLDLCEFNNILVGAAEKDTSSSTNVGAMIGARACITNPATDIWVVTIAWQGLMPTAKPEEACGSGAYGNDALRRTVSLVLRRAVLF